MKTLLIETLLVFITFILVGILYTLDNAKVDIHSAPPKVQSYINKNCEGQKDFINSGNIKLFVKMSKQGAFCSLLFARFPTEFIESSSEVK
jgi:hypothetical protein